MLGAVKNLRRTIVDPPQTRIPRHGVDLEQLGLNYVGQLNCAIEKKIPHVSGSLQFKTVLFKDQLYYIKFNYIKIH